MTEEEYGKRYTDLVRLYRSSPGSFSPDDVDQIEYIAKTLGRRFVRDPQAAEDSLGKQIGDVIGQFTSGLVSGFTTIPIGDDPEDIPEAIARSIGQLGGFLGYVPGLGMATKAGAMASARILTKTAGLTAKTSPKAFKAAMQGRRAVKQFDTAIRQPGALVGKSIPMMVGRKATEYAKKYVLPPVNNQARKYFSKGVAEGLEDSFETAVQLGAASAISSWTGGVDQMIRGGIFGALEGGVFRGITNATQLGQMITKGGKEAKRANLAIRTISSSIYGGMQSKAFGDPIELQIYHYLLGAFFGVTDIPFAQRKAVEFINKSRNLTFEEAQAPLTERMLNPELNPGFKDLSKEVQDEVSDQLLMMFGKPGDAQSIFGEALGNTITDEGKQFFVRDYARRKFEQFLDEEGTTIEEARAKAYDAIKGKKFGDLITDEDFYIVSNNIVNADYDPSKGPRLSNESIIKMSFEDHELPQVLQDPLLQWAESSLSSQPELVSNLALRAGQIINDNIKEKRSFEETIRNVYDKTGFDLKESEDSINLLKKSYKKLSQVKPIRVLKVNRNADASKGEAMLQESDGILSDFRRINESKSESSISLALKDLNREIFLAKYTDDNVQVNDLFKSFFDDSGRLVEQSVVDYARRAASEGKPVIAGIKDSGKFIHSDGWLFDDTTNQWISDLSDKVTAINEADPTINLTINPDNVLAKYQYNNIKLLEQLNGLAIEDIVRHNREGTGSFITKPDEINKRMQPMADGNPSLDASIGPLRAAIIKGNTDVQDDTGRLDTNEVGTDGIVYLSKKAFGKIANDIGATTKDGFIKFTVAGKQNDDLGMIIGKLGAFRANGSAEKFMQDNGLDIMMYDTAVKQRGLRKVTTLKFSDLEINPVEGDAIEAFNINPETIRVNLGVYEKMPKDTRMVKQFMSLLTDDAAIKRMQENVIDRSLNGDEALNKSIASGRITGKEIDNLNVDDISVENIYGILFQKQNGPRVFATKLYNKVWSHIFGQVTEESFIDPSDLKGEPGDLDGVLPEVLLDDFNSSSDRLIKTAIATGQLSPALLNRPQVASFANEALKRYVFNRAVRPKIKNSGSTFIYGNDLFLQHDLKKPVEAGTYMFAKSMKDFNVKWIDGTQMKMGKAWELYQKETDATKKKQMEDALEFIVVRVPQDSPSGARALKFAGFSNREGYGMHLNGMDMEYLGGADNDGDKVHFYQDLDGDLGGSPIKDAVIKNKDQWSDGKGGVLDAKRNANVDKEDFNLSNGLDIKDVISTHLYTTDGNRLVGPGANAGATATGTRALFNSGIPAGRQITLDQPIPVSPEKAIVKIRIDEIDQSLREFDDLRREIMNVAVDATGQLPYNTRSQGSLLTQKLIKKVTFIDNNGDEIAPNDRAIRQVNFNKIDSTRDLVAINETINGKRFQDGKSQLIKFDTAMKELKDFGVKYTDIDLGNAYYSAVKSLSKIVKDTYKPVNPNVTDETYAPELSRAIRLNVNQVFDIVNAYVKDNKDSEYGNVLAASGAKSFSILRGDIRRDRKFSTLKSVYNAIDNIVSLSLNKQTYDAAKKVGVSENQLSSIRNHIDKVKYTQSVFYTRNKNHADYVRNKILKEDRLSIREVNNVDELNVFTEKYYNSLKTKQERDYYDFYMLGSLSEQNLNIDDIARTVYITKTAASKNNNIDYNRALQMSEDPAYDKYTYEYLSSDDYKNTADEGLKNIKNEVERVFQNKNNSQYGFSLKHIDNNNVATWISRFNDLAQVKENVKRSQLDIVSQESSSIVERMLLKNIDPVKKQEVLKKINKELTESEYRYPSQFGSVASVSSFFDKTNTSRAPIDELEARRASINDEIITEKLSEDLLDKILQDEPTKEFSDTDKALLNELEAHLSKLPSNIVENINQVYESYIRKEIGMSTTDDVRNFVTFLNRFHSKTFLEKLVGADPSQKVSRIYWLFFPDSMARRLTSVDPNLSEAKIVQVLTKDGYKSKEVRDVMSHYEMMRLSLNTVEEARSALVNRITGKINDELTYLNDESIINDRNDLIESSVAIKEMANINRLRGIAKNSKDEDKVTNALWSIKKYEENYNNKLDVYNRLKNKKYTIYIDGVKTQVTGKDLMGAWDGVNVESGRISNSITNLNNFFFDAFINPTVSSDFVVRRNDGSMDAEATLNKMIQQFQGTKMESERIANIGLSNLFELSRELDYLNNTRVKVGNDRVLIKDIKDPELKERKLFEIRMNDRGQVRSHTAFGTDYKLNPDGTFVLSPMIGKLKAEEYFPHKNHSDEAQNEYAKEFYLSKDIDVLTDKEYLNLKRLFAQGKIKDDGGLAKEYIENSFRQIDFVDRTNRKSNLTKFGNLAGRTDRIIGGWDIGINAYDQYAQSLSSSYHKLYGTILAQKYNRDFRESNVMGDVTESWAKFGDIYIQDFVGKPSSFSDEYFADPLLNFKKSPYYALSDDMAMKYYNKVAKFFNFKQYNDDEIGRLEFQGKMKSFTKLEGKTQLMTLLTNTTSMLNNYVGGTAQTAISSGFRPWRLANDWKYLRDNIDSSIDSPEKARELAIRFGATESYISSEVGPTAQLKANVKKFMSELSALHKTGDFTKEQVIEIAKRNGTSDVIAGPGAWMMSSVETRLRTRSFWAHYLQARETMMAEGSTYRWDDPVLIQTALKGVWGSQFLYNAPNRPAIARTNLGRIFSRFQLWSWNSIRFRRDIIKIARENGFQQGTPEYQRFVRMVQADTFMFAMATLMPMSMFESILPAPWNYLQDFSDYFFGDEDERDKAFFGQIPYPFNPLQIALPPSARYITTGVSVPIEMAIAMLSDKDLSDALDYRAVSLLPYGMLARNIVRSVDTPAMAPQYLTGIHFHNLTRIMNKLEDSATYKANGLYEAKSRFVDEEIEKILEAIKE